MGPSLAQASAGSRTAARSSTLALTRREEAALAHRLVHHGRQALVTRDEQEIGVHAQFQRPSGVAQRGIAAEQRRGAQHVVLVGPGHRPDNLQEMVQ